MSEKQNYDKILLASGIVLGLGVAVYGTVTLLGLNDKYKFTTQVSEKAIEPPPGIKKAAEVNQELSASHELKPIAQETQQYVGFVAPNLWIKEGGMEPFDIISDLPSTATSRTNGSWTTVWKMSSFTRTSSPGTLTTTDSPYRRNMRLKRIPMIRTATHPSSTSSLWTKSSSSAFTWPSRSRTAMTSPSRA